MLELVHTHWKRRPVCKVRCLGVPTVDMNNVCRCLEVCHSFYLVGNLFKFSLVILLCSCSMFLWGSVMLQDELPKKNSGLLVSHE